MMTSSANYSDINVRPRRYRGLRSSKKSILYSDYNTEEETKNGSLNQRSISLTALPHNGSSSTGTAAPATPAPMSGPLLEPRMAQLETLEAKMASIEVSLSTAQRRKNGKKNGSGIISNVSKSTTMLVPTSPATIFASIRSNTLIDTCRELEVLRNALKDKENTIQNLQGQINGCGRLTSLQPLDPCERRSAELRLQTLKQEEESKRAAIKKINLSLEQMDSNESNIDVRIRQAELEYELGREELCLLGIREEIRTLQARLDAKPSLTLYSSINSSGKYTLHCVQLEYDAKSPRFGAGNVDDKIGLFVLWAADNSGLCKGDRILEVNGKLTLSTSKEEMIRLLTVCPSRAEMVILRLWIPPPSTEDFLRRENLRLTHRISYLEDQVSELLLAVPSKDVKLVDKSTEIFQKGGHKALLSANLKNGTKTNSANNYNSIVKVSGDGKESGLESPKVNGEPVKNTSNIMISVNGYHVPLGPTQKYQDSCGGNEKSRNPKHDSEDILSPTNRSRWIKNGDTNDEFHKKHFKNIVNNSYSLSDMEKSSRKSSHYHPAKTVDYSSETNYSKYKSLRDKKDVDDSIYSKKCDLSEPENGRTGNTKPTPPKKPIRLSINRAASLQSVETNYSLQNGIRKIKRPHKGEAPPPPIFQENKMNGCHYATLSDLNLHHRNHTKIESWTSNQHKTNQINEKWC